MSPSKMEIRPTSFEAGRGGSRGIGKARDGALQHGQVGYRMVRLTVMGQICLLGLQRITRNT